MPLERKESLRDSRLDSDLDRSRLPLEVQRNSEIGHLESVLEVSSELLKA